MSRLTPSRFGAASDTTTVALNARHDLSGGGTRLVAPGDVSIHPGTLLNLGNAADRFDISVSPAALDGFDSLDHPTQLWVDTNAETCPIRSLARDNEGDGVWDLVNPAYDTDSDNLPDVAVNAGATLSYELRRPVDPAQVLERPGDAHHALRERRHQRSRQRHRHLGVRGRHPRQHRGVRVDAAQGIVEFATGNQSRTASFRVFQTSDPSGAEELEPLHEGKVVSPVPDSLRPILYRVDTRPITQPYLMIEETELDGDRFMKGPFPVGDARLASPEAGRSPSGQDGRHAGAGAAHAPERSRRAAGWMSATLPAPRSRSDRTKGRTPESNAGVPQTPPSRSRWSRRAW